jgi:proline iminopeptidase
MVIVVLYPPPCMEGSDRLEIRQTKPASYINNKQEANRLLTNSFKSLILPKFLLMNMISTPSIKSSTLILFLLFFVLNGAHGQITNEEYIQVSDSTKLYTKLSGKGPFLIFVHGGPGAWSKSFEVLGGRNIEDEFTVLYYDQRGCGRSESPSNQDYSLQRMIKDLDEIRQHYQIPSFYLMGHSFGGILITEYAKIHPEPLKGIILLNATLNIEKSLSAQTNYFKSALNITEKRPAEDEGILAAFLHYQNEIDSKIPSDFAFAQRALSISDYMQDFAPQTSTIKIPTLVFTGKKDYAIGVDHYKSFQFPNQTIIQFENGHVAYYEENSLFKSELVRFKNSHK